MIQTEKLTDQYATPPEFFNWVEKEFKCKFDLDVCASHENHKCERYFTKEKNALAAQTGWKGQTIWCNPPYSDPRPWVQKMIASVGNGIALRGAMLLKLDSSTQWFRLCDDHAQNIVLLAPRIQFVPPSGIKASTNNFSSMLALFGYFETFDAYKSKYFFKRWK